MYGVPDKKLANWLEGKEYKIVSDEGVAVGMAAGEWYATRKPSTVFMSADGFCNALNAITSFIIPEEIEMKFVISTGRQEPQHRVMSHILEEIIILLHADPKRLSFEFLS